MRFKNGSLCLAAAAAAMLLGSCAEEADTSYTKYEALSLQAYMTQNAPQYVVENAQTAVEGSNSYTYYVDVLDAGDPDAEPLGSDNFWITYDFSGRDLTGDIVLTRSAYEAVWQNTFTKYTHYVPYYRYCGEKNSGLIEGTWVAMRNTLYLSDNYMAEYGSDPSRRLTSNEVQLRPGSKVVLYLPSSIVGKGMEGTGGYEGQYSLDAGKPCIITMAIESAVENPIEVEGDAVDNYCKAYGGLVIYQKADTETGTPANEAPTDPDDLNHPYNITERWVSACDTIPQLYVNYRYAPDEILTVPTDSIYVSGYEPYKTQASMQSVNERIAAALKARFDPDDAYDNDSVKTLDADSVKLDGTAKIWYIGRFMDGFIFDTNIDEVKEIIYGKGYTKGSVLTYTPKSGGLIQAFYYTVPNLKFGQWAAFLTTSTYAYGATGQAGASSTSSSGGSSSNYYDYMNYMNYANSYYGNSGYYGGYYNNYYNNYNSGYYGNYGSGASSSTTTKTTTVSTEILPYTPLIFEFYIEPAK